MVHFVESQTKNERKNIAFIGLSDSTSCLFARDQGTSYNVLREARCARERELVNEKVMRADINVLFSGRLGKWKESVFSVVSDDECARNTARKVALP